MATESNLITLGLPTKYTSSSPSHTTSAPSLEWLTTTWSVTHSTLAMWRPARNVRITYKPLPANNGVARLGDLVEYEPSNKEGVLKSITGIDTQAPGGSAASWNWRGKGLLLLLTSHWEILGSGEATTATGERERWAVTWFAPTLFTAEGLDVYCDRKEGLSAETYEAITQALGALAEPRLVEMVKKDMKPVEIRLPWVEK